MTTAADAPPESDSVPAPEPQSRGLAGPGPARILCVDSNPEMLAALRRVFKDSGYSVRIADSSVTGLHILENEPIDLVLSEMHLPQRDGDRFLAQVREQWPQAMRMLLTDEADAERIAEVVKSSDIYRYVAKPWVDEDLLLQVRLALERRALDLEKARMQQLAVARNEELKALNASLEQNASSTQDELTQANRRLKNNFIVSLKVFASLIEARRKHMVGHARRVADLARKLAMRLELEPALVHEVFVAGLLHDIGKVGLDDDLLDTTVANMTGRQLKLYRLHPARAEELLMPLQDLRGAAASIGAQMERFDGTGFPRRLQGRAILVGARILAVCSDYDNLQIGVLVPRLLTPREALGIVERSAGRRYDPWVVTALSDLLRGRTVAGAGEPGAEEAGTADTAELDDDLLVAVADLAEGMVLSRDLISPGGLMMLPAGHTIDKRLVRKMRDFEKTDDTQLVIHVRKLAPAGSAQVAGMP